MSTIDLVLISYNNDIDLVPTIIITQSSILDKFVTI